MPQLRHEIAQSLYGTLEADNILCFAGIALKNKDKILARNNKIVSDNLKILDQFFSNYQHLFSWVSPQGGCVGFVEYRSNEHVDIFVAGMNFLISSGSKSVYQ